MNHCVPEFELEEEDHLIHPSSGLIRPKRSAMAEEDIMELLWQNGQVVVQSRNQRSFKRPHPGGSGSASASGNGSGIADGTIPVEQSIVREIRSAEDETPPQHLFMQEDEMASWLHCPLDDSFDRDLYTDLLYPSPSTPIATTTTVRTVAMDVRPPLPLPPPSAAVMAPRPPIPPPRRTEAEASPKFLNFGHFSRLPKARIDFGPSTSGKAARELTEVESNETPMIRPESRVSLVVDSTALVSGDQVGCRTTSGTTAAAGASTAARDMTTTCELTVTSSPGGSGGSISATAEAPATKATPTAAEDRKRKGREADENECQSEDLEFRSVGTKKQDRGSSSTKRSRAAEVHNLSERRRRDRINEKMRALQELIPRCNKTDKASMLDEAIEYLKSLQLQVQMMSMGCGMVPMMYPGMQQYMPPMGMGMGMGMGMDMSMNRPMLPYPSLLPGSAMQNAAAAAQMAPRFPLPAFHMSPVPVPDPSRIQASNQSDPAINSFVCQNPNQPRFPNFADPHQQYLTVHQAQAALTQNQVIEQPTNNRPSGSKEPGKPSNRQSG